jgi:glutamate-ammonia-ligase adenylyltransferase
VQPLPSLIDYYRGPAGLWEIQALLKARPVAGSEEIGRRLLQAVTPLLTRRRSGAEIALSIARMRDQAIQKAGGEDSRNVKSGEGGIRDVEFLVQGLQLHVAPSNPEVVTGNTVTAIRRLMEVGVIDPKTAAELEEDYTLLRRVEHVIQVLNDQQRHELPTDAAEMQALARRVLPEGGGAEELEARLGRARVRVRELYRTTLSGLSSPAPTDR